MTDRKAMFILYVKDQQRSARFYTSVLGREPQLDVPGMTEYRLTDGVSVGLMPNAGIKRLLGDALPDPDAGLGIPRAELYLIVPDAAGAYQLALDSGARAISAPSLRDWGDRAAYCLDPDGHVLAFADTKPADTDATLEQP